jgi:hypothetical protein
MASEEWRPVVGYEGKYEVSDQGRVRNATTLRLIKQTRRREMWSVHLYGFPISTTTRLLVADAFVPLLPDNVRIIEHINGNRLDCRAENLKWKTKAQDESGEEWRTIQKCDQYLVSNRGRVMHKENRQIRSLRPNGHGYLMVSVTQQTNGLHHFCPLVAHRLVAEAFLERRDPSQNEVRHLNGIKTDNRVENLAWGKSIDNQADAKRLHEYPNGSCRKNSKLKESDVVVIRRIVCGRRGLRYRVSKLFGISVSNVSDTKNLKLWRHVP